MEVVYTTLARWSYTALFYIAVPVVLLGTFGVLAACGLVGLATGAGVLWLRVPPFIMSMAMSIIVA